MQVSCKQHVWISKKRKSLHKLTKISKNEKLLTKKEKIKCEKNEKHCKEIESLKKNMTKFELCKRQKFGFFPQLPNFVFNQVTKKSAELWITNLVIFLK